MELYAVRHGETDWNAIGKICGRTDVPLSTNGERQAEALAERLMEEGARFDRIIASPMLRTRQTAGYVSERLGLPVETDERLIEQCYGAYEGRDVHTPGFLQNKRQFACRYPGGESMMDVAARAYAFLEALKRRTDLQSVLLVSHGGLLRVLNTYFEDVENDAFFHWGLGNTEVRRYTLT